MLEESIRDVAERIERYGDRSRNAGDLTAEQEARAAAARAGGAQSLDDALSIERVLTSSPIGTAQAPVPPNEGFFQKLQRWFGGRTSDADLDSDDS